MCVSNCLLMFAVFVVFQFCCEQNNCNATCIGYHSCLLRIFIMSPFMLACWVGGMRFEKIAAEVNLETVPRKFGHLGWS